MWRTPWTEPKRRGGGLLLKFQKMKQSFKKSKTEEKNLDPCLVDTKCLTYLYPFSMSQLMSCLIFVCFEITAPCRMNQSLPCQYTTTLFSLNGLKHFKWEFPSASSLYSRSQMGTLLLFNLILSGNVGKSLRHVTLNFTVGLFRLHLRLNHKGAYHVIIFKAQLLHFRLNRRESK